jgi:hypothetical protein
MNNSVKATTGMASNDTTVRLFPTIQAESTTVLAIADYIKGIQESRITTQWQRPKRRHMPISTYKVRDQVYLDIHNLPFSSSRRDEVLSSILVIPVHSLSSRLRQKHPRTNYRCHRNTRSADILTEDPIQIALERCWCLAESLWHDEPVEHVERYLERRLC